MTSERSRTIAFALLIIGAIAVVAGAAVPWYSADGLVHFSGSDITGGVAQALGVAILAGVLLMLALRATGRRIVAVLVGLIALLGVITMPLQRPDSAEVFTELRKHTLADSYHLQLVGGSIAYAVGCLLVLAGAVIVLLRAGRWPQRASRFERAAAQQRTLLPADPDAEIDAGAVWKSIDAGEDPTLPPDSKQGN
ncbi:Trp biosynthesis-associated membrane protein [Microlunatus elymi]|uniref:Trp biosynthesis-associated membrane protein n=1 Tax=Microlunatus elymi TaxID=2596828 RepID=A0A516Q0K5_9ACTN|nr:Trp biosynthesis-associated membrane protein [Microlunatus elymi]QDP96976.1 Trp biosynthesis-associated membrane protein [Microlunatus elymi]